MLYVNICFTYYRSTPHVTMEKTSAELHLNRRLRTRLDIIKPDIRSRIEQKQSDQQCFFKGNRTVIFGINDSMIAKYYRTKWRQATIIEQTSLVTYNVKTDDGRIWRRHIDQLRTCNLRSPGSNSIKSSELSKDSVTSDKQISLTPSII